MCQLCRCPVSTLLLWLHLFSGCATPSEPTLLPPLAADAGNALLEEQVLTCVEVVTPAEQDTTEYRRLTWYADRRTLKTEVAKDVELATADGADLTLFANDGRPIRRIGLGSRSQQRRQEDYFYDEHDNRVDYRFSYPLTPSLDEPSSDEPWSASRNIHEYDAQGRLTATTMESYGGGDGEVKRFRRVYGEDEAGRCAFTEAPEAWSSIRREDFRYDERSRLREYEVGSGDYQCEHALARLDYDERDRLLTVQTQCNGTAGRTEQHTYNADGGETVELTTSLTSQPRPYRRERSADCLRIDLAVGKPAAQRCRVAPDSN